MFSNDMANELKVAAIRLLLKKIILDLIFKNYRAVSNLHFIGKVVENVVLVRLVEHALQSAYRQFH